MSCVHMELFTSCFRVEQLFLVRIHEWCVLMVYRVVRGAVARSDRHLQFL